MQQPQATRCTAFALSGIARRHQGNALKILSLGVAIFFMGQHPAWSADDYLSELDAEVKKVEARKIDGESGQSVSIKPSESSTKTFGNRPVVSRDNFEALLKQRYLGTYGFYKKLPERNREEIFLEYRSGAPMTVVRKKIIDRLLQR